MPTKRQQQQAAEQLATAHQSRHGRTNSASPEDRLTHAEQQEVQTILSADFFPSPELLTTSNLAFSKLDAIRKEQRRHIATKNAASAALRTLKNKFADED